MTEIVRRKKKGILLVLGLSIAACLHAANVPTGPQHKKEGIGPRELSV